MGIHNLHCAHGGGRIGGRILICIDCVHRVNPNCTKIAPECVSGKATQSGFLTPRGKHGEPPVGRQSKQRFANVGPAFKVAAGTPGNPQKADAPRNRGSHLANNLRPLRVSQRSALVRPSLKARHARQHAPSSNSTRADSLSEPGCLPLEGADCLGQLIQRGLKRRFERIQPMARR
jgi:hypothetical protein